MRFKKTSNIIIIIFFFLYLILGISTYKDYGINIEEHTQLFSGIYWLNYVYQFFDIHFLIGDVTEYLNYISKDFQLPNPKKYTYGPVFDLPTSFLDILSGNKVSNSTFEQRHLLVFLSFYLSSIFFFLILKKRFNNFFISFFGLLIFIFSPRIYGDSFHNNKDIIFLSLSVLCIYHAFKIFEEKKVINIILFSFFAALATSTRIMGIFFPFSVLLFIYLEKFNYKNKVLSKSFFLIILFYFLFLFIHWPFLWEAPTKNFLKFITNSKEWIFSYYILFQGEYFLTTNLPDSYIFTWICISTPILNLVFFFFGFWLMLKRFFNRFISIEKIKFNFCDFWRSKNEMKDYFIFFNLVSILSILFSLNVSFVSGWRHLYYLNIFIIFIAVYSVNIIILKYKNFNLLVKILLFLFLIPNFIKVIKYHPYQSLYFNELISDRKKNLFLVDREGLSRLDSIKKIINMDNKKKINIANASFVPYYRIGDALTNDERKRVNFVGTDYKNADYIFNNYVYEINPKYDDKYEIPSNFKQIYELKIDGVRIYELYKRK